MDDEVELELLRQLQLVVEDDLGRLLRVAAHVVDKVVDGHVELLDLAGQVHTGHPGGPKGESSPLLVFIAGATVKICLRLTRWPE